jgi:hypothetical protein
MFASYCRWRRQTPAPIGDISLPMKERGIKLLTAAIVKAEERYGRG